MDIIFHGGAEQVGRSCIEVVSKETRVLLDAGLWITRHGPEFPTEIKDIQNIDGIIISHAHLDHTGALPLFEHYGIKCKVYANKETKEITKVLLKDSFKISLIEHSHVAYEKRDIGSIIARFEDVPYSEAKEVGSIRFMFLPSGHIPGSASVLLEAEGKKLLYSGDINTKESRLLKEAYTDFSDIDTLIIESTYGNRDHPDRMEEEKRFIKKVRETIARGGIALVPAFAVGRAQEILLLLEENKIEAPVYLDGMGRSIAEIFIENPGYIKDDKAFRKAVEKVRFVKDWKERNDVVKEPCVIITSSGMVNGGPALFYLKKIFRRTDSSIFLTGYQAKGTNGRMLIEEESAFIDGNLIHVDLEIDKFDFSAHSGKKELHEMILEIRPKRIIINHGDKKAMEDLESWCKSLGIETIIAKNDEVIRGG
jgi:putative mRNA 3-end processing factor